MELIDYFKYKSLLAELEKVKGTKKPLRDFINRIYELSNNFSLTHKGEKTPESARYCFMLASRALSYNTGNIIIKDKLVKDLKTLSITLLTSGAVTPENVLETYEFWDKSLYIDIRRLNDVHILEPLIAKMNPDIITIYAGLLSEFFMYVDTEVALSVYLKRALYPDNAISRILDKKLEYFSKTVQAHVIKRTQDDMREKALTMIERHTQILKELDEHYSTSSDAVK